MKTIFTTLAIVLTAGVALIAYDVYLVLRYGVDQTISWQMHQWALGAPIVPAFLGLLCGFLGAHFFAPGHGADRTPLLAYLLSLFVGVVLSWLFWSQG